MKRLLWIFLLLAGGLPLFAQATPDCVIGFNFTATGQRSSITGCGNNKAQGVIEWQVAYTNTGFTGPLSLRLESSQDGITWIAFAGTLNTGINPNTSITHAATDMSGFNSFVSVALNAAAGSGTVQGVLYGCRQPGCAGSAASGGGSVVPNPLPVDGPTAAGSAPTTPPVLVAGQDGAPGLIRTLKTDSVGELIPANTPLAGSDGVSNTEATPTGAAAAPLYMRVLPYITNGTTNDRQFNCIFQAVVIFAPGTTGRIITGTIGKRTKICHYHETSGSTLADVTVNSGTGTNCGTGTAQIDGYIGVPSFAMDFQPTAPLQAAAVGDDVCFTFSTSVTATVVAIYAQI